MSLPLDDLIALAGNRPPDRVGTVDQAAAAIRDAATAEHVDLTDPTVARAVLFGVHCPIYIAAALTMSTGAMRLAMHVTAAAAAHAQESTT